MIQLIIDGKVAIPNSTANIKLTRENAYFTKSSSYTYDVDLPLDIAENRRIFGWVQRMDVTKSPQRFDAVLIVDNETVLTGSAHITQVSETSVKVQLLGEAASYNYGNKMDDTYIDELDLGNWYDTTWPGDGSGAGHRLAEDLVTKAGYRDDGSYDYSGETLYSNLFSGKYPWVMLPVVNSSAEIQCNSYAYRFTSTDKNQVKIFLRTYDGERTGTRPSDAPPTSSIAAQPYVWVMAQKIAEATGFSLDKEDNGLYKNEFFRRIFIVNANSHIDCNKSLPHWTVNEWWTQLENTFGLVMSINYASKSMRLMQRKDHYREQRVEELTEVVDEFTTEINDETESDISANNVGFADWEHASCDLLSEFVKTSAVVNTEFASLAELLSWAKERGASAMSGMKNVIFECSDGRHYIYTEKDGIVEVDMFRPRMVNAATDDVELELKFVPAKYVDGECHIYPYYERHGGNPEERRDIPLGSFPVRMLEVPNLSDMAWYKNRSNPDLDIEDVLDSETDGETETDSVPDVVYMAIADLGFTDSVTATVELRTGGSYTDTFKHPRGLLRQRGIGKLDGAARYQDGDMSLSLIPIKGQNNLASNTVSGMVSIGTTVRHCIKFVADRIPDVDAIFLIRNKRFVCEKVEAGITPEGLDRLMTGYFYELEL